jgi:hypothetical protein
MVSGIICLIAGFVSVPIFINLGVNNDSFYLMGLIGSSIFIVGGLILNKLHKLVEK